MSLEPAKWNFTIWQGATFRQLLTFFTGTESDSPPKDLTDFSALLEIRDQAEGTVLFELSTGNSRINLGGLDGTIELIITATDTAEIAWDYGVYDLIITDTTPGGDTDALLFGGFRVKGI